jgi:hypothetical protein
VSRPVRILFLLLVVAIVAAAVVNVYGDGTAVEQLARRTACAGRTAECKARMTRVARTPFFHEIQFEEPHGSTMTVRCQRAFYLVGDYSCASRG